MWILCMFGLCDVTLTLRGDLRKKNKVPTSGYTNDDREDQQLLPLYPALVIRNIFSVKQLIGWGVFAQAVFRSGARIHEGLSHHG